MPNQHEYCDLLTYKLVGRFYRLYDTQQQATTAWRGSNDRTRAIRHPETNAIMSFDTIDGLQTYAKQRFGCTAWANE